MNNALTRSNVLYAIALACLVLALGHPTAPAAAAPRSDAPDFAAIDAYVQAEMQAARVPGLALGIVHGDQIVHVKGFGIADPSGRPVRRSTAPVPSAACQKRFVVPVRSEPKISRRPSGVHTG